MDIVKIDTGGLCGAVLGPEHPAGGSWRDSCPCQKQGVALGGRARASSMLEARRAWHLC
jgi:hypothetical protein